MKKKILNCKTRHTNTKFLDFFENRKIEIPFKSEKTECLYIIDKQPQNVSKFNATTRKVNAINHIKLVNGNETYLKPDKNDYEKKNVLFNDKTKLPQQLDIWSNNLKSKKIKKKYRFKAVIVDDPGNSYNPKNKDYTKLLEKIGLNETRLIDQKKYLKKMKISKHLNNVMNVEDDVKFEDPVSEVDFMSINPPVVAESKLSKKQRRKKMQQIKFVKDKIKRKAERIQKNDEFRIKSIRKNVDHKIRLNKIEKTKINIKRLEASNLIKRLGFHKFEPVEQVTNDSNDITGHFRTLKVSGSMSLDRYKSLQMRNMIYVPKYCGKRQKITKCDVKETRVYKNIRYVMF
ncbi:hypothetical protein A3Q56_06904 [Intoshia linei]|uniref:Ribosome biogenesis protein NOP53 n=1 Tax=Intoshia linei TaxID=1819745 RepID=A0A177AU94_9BILA|nr:hypothetical protein A3Q56_06904 [Intoshia linei]